MKVDMVSRTLGRHKGEAAILLCDAEMISRALDSVKAIASANGVAYQSLSNNHDLAVSNVLETLMHNMETPAVDLLSDFRDSYTALRNQIVEVHLEDSVSTHVFGIIPTLSREGSATVRVSKLEVKKVRK